jgi:hypothetical protein
VKIAMTDTPRGPTDPGKTEIVTTAETPDQMNAIIMTANIEKETLVDLPESTEADLAQEAETTDHLTCPGKHTMVTEETLLLTAEEETMDPEIAITMRDQEVAIQIQVASPTEEHPWKIERGQLELLSGHLQESLVKISDLQETIEIGIITEVAMKEEGLPDNSEEEMTVNLAEISTEASTQTEWKKSNAACVRAFASSARSRVTWQRIAPRTTAACQHEVAHLSVLNSTTTEETDQ